MLLPKSPLLEPQLNEMEIVSKMENTVVSTFRVHPSQELRFTSITDSKILQAHVCSCGHPQQVHNGICMLGEVCGCARFKEVIFVTDIRPFFQSTHGPLEAHALSRGITVAYKQGIDVFGELKCDNYCSSFHTIGACRVSKSRIILAKPRDGERHLILCNVCVDDLVLASQRNLMLF